MMEMLSQEQFASCSEVPQRNNLHSPPSDREILEEAKALLPSILRMDEGLR